MQQLKWRAILGIILILIALFTSSLWLWGIIIILLVIPDLRRGSTHLLEPVNRSTDPILFNIICYGWLLLALLLIISPFID